MDTARLYVEAHRSFIYLFESLTSIERELAVPCLPGWSVRDVLSHVAGIADDVVSGNAMATTAPEWTAAQVDRWRETDTIELMGQWKGQVNDVGAVLAATREVRPAIDCHMHEHDIRQAAGKPGPRDTEVISIVARGLRRLEAGRPVLIELTDGEPIQSAGDGSSITLRNVSTFEVARSRLGRRSLTKFLSYDWSEPPSDSLISSWFHFGPSGIDIIE